MSNKTELQANNVDLQAILSTINELPEAGSQLETCDLLIDRHSCDLTIYYTTIVDGQIVTKNDSLSSVHNTVQVLLHSIFYLVTNGNVMDYDGISMISECAYEMLSKTEGGSVAHLTILGIPD